MGVKLRKELNDNLTKGSNGRRIGTEEEGDIRIEEERGQGDSKATTRPFSAPEHPRGDGGSGGRD
jgi:hypothetical protein